MAVIFCVCRDCYGYPDNMSQFEREFDCSEGLLSNTFRNNPYMRMPIDKWQTNGAKERVLRLVDVFKNAVNGNIAIAELTGKKHNHLMRNIRNMEPAWMKITGLKFQLCEKTYQMANGVKKAQPYYQLTKTECLYIATKFNDEARAKLVLMYRTRSRERRRFAHT